MRIITKKITTVTAAFALAVGATLSLSACFGNPIEGLVKGGAGDIIKNATGAEVDLGGTSIPQDFPPQIPIAEGEIEYGGSVKVDGNKMWTVRIKTTDASAFSKVQDKLISSGFEEGFVTEGETQMGSYEGHGYSLILNLDEVDGAYGLTYVVSEDDGEE